MQNPFSRDNFANDPWLHSIGKLMLAGEMQKALAQLLPALTSPSATARVFEFAIICYIELRDDKTALALAEVACAAFADDPWIWNQKGRIALQCADDTEARRCFEQALALCPVHIPALIALNLLQTFDKGSDLDRRLRKAARSKTASRRELASAHSGIARIEEKAGNHAAAFYHHTQCNKMRDGTHDPSEDAALVATQASLFAPLPEPAVVGPAPYVFIGGMPRSGTTVLETALLRHPLIDSIGETSTLAQVNTRALKMAEAKGPLETHWDWANRLDDAQMLALRQDLISAFQGGRAGGRVVLEKMPLACLRFGLAHHLLPEARFIHMRRHPLDCGLSNYVTNFERGYDYATRLDWIAAKQRATDTAARDYAAKLGHRFRMQSFHALVEHPEDQLRAIVAHIGLEWDPACLSPEENTKIQRTASMMQVREGFNTKGIGKWRAYEKQLRPLIKALGPDYAHVRDTLDDRMALNMLAAE